MDHEQSPGEQSQCNS